MATLVLAGIGSAVGASLGGGILGISSVVIGKAVGATLGAVIDQRVFGAGSEAVEVGRAERLRIMGSREGAAMERIWGQMRVAGQVIWSSNFMESVKVSGGGKGTPSVPETKEYSYSVSVGIAVCEGEITRLGRVWADGQIVDTSQLNMRLYHGDETQLADPLIAASLGADLAPAYRGTAYVVIEDLALASYGNRIPQFTFEVIRRADGSDPASEPMRNVEAVALVPGTGEYSLATTSVSFVEGKGETKVANVNNDQGRPDLNVALDNLVAELPNCGSVSLVVSWFGSDLRCGECIVEPKVEQADVDGKEMAWSVSGEGRTTASVVSQIGGRPGFGGTPADKSVLQAIAKLQELGQTVMFYPFILMDIRSGNGLPDPWGQGAEQPAVPWRGRITGALAPGQTGSPDKTAAATTQVAAFFGTAQASDFAIGGNAVVYSGPAEWSYRRFILHYAWLCKLAGGVDAFCIGSEMRSLTQLRDGPASFPAVQQLVALAAEVRSVLGAETKISYAADWSEYFGYHPGDGSGDVFYHLDPLWSDTEIDFIGIDNYMPLSDWRDGDDHLDASYGSIQSLDYLKANVAGGEGYDWFYASDATRDRQERQEITDGAYDEPWTFRYKDIRNWWSLYHWNRIGGVKEASTTSWVPQSKPIWFTEYGCPAVDKGTNQPNVFLDPQSTENALPYHSDGGQDRYIQQRYLQAVKEFWSDESENPLSTVYGGPMIDMSHAFVWAWDGRPWPDFPNRMDVWSDGLNHARGHWISGRAQLVAVADVVEEVCTRAGLGEVDVSALEGMLQGYSIVATESARESLQPLMLAYSFDAFEREGTLTFRNRDAEPARTLDAERLAVGDEDTAAYEVSRIPEAEMPARVRVTYVHPEKDYQSATAEAQVPASEEQYTAGSNLPVALSHEEASEVAARWLAETQVSRDQLALFLPRSDLDLGPGDVIELEVGTGPSLYRIDRVEEAAARRVEAVRVEKDVFKRAPFVPELIVTRGENLSGAPAVEIMDLPLLTGEENPYALRVAAAHVPWEGSMAAYSAAQDNSYGTPAEIVQPSLLATLKTDLTAASPGRWANQSFDIEITDGALESRDDLAVLNGANAAALRNGAGDWEIIQFQSAELIVPRYYRLSRLLRGQAGTEPLIPDVWPEGTDVVVLDAAQIELDVPPERLGLDLHVRVGPADRSYSDPRFIHQVVVPMGVGYRPYAPVHLAGSRLANSDIDLTWIRRARTGGDRWDLADVPLSEAGEAYVVKVFDGETLVREVTTTAQSWTYSSAQQTTDGIAGGITFDVAQVSEIYGSGLSARMTFND